MAVRRWFARSGLLLDVVLGKMLCSITLLVGMVDCRNSRLILNYYQSELNWVSPRCLPKFVTEISRNIAERSEAKSKYLKFDAKLCLTFLASL